MLIIVHRWRPPFSQSAPSFPSCIHSLCWFSLDMVWPLPLSCNFWTIRSQSRTAPNQDTTVVFITFIYGQCWNLNLHYSIVLQIHTGRSSQTWEGLDGRRPSYLLYLYPNSWIGNIFPWNLQPKTVVLKMRETVLSYTYVKRYVKSTNDY